MEMGVTMLQAIQNKHAVLAPKNTSAALRVDGLFNLSGRIHNMFGKRKDTKELAPLLSDAEIYGTIYDEVMDFLVSINDDDFSKVVKIAELYRKNHVDVAEITGIAQTAQPSIFELVKAPAVRTQAADTGAGNFLDEDDDLSAAFLDDAEPTADKKASKSSTADDAKDLQS